MLKHITLLAICMLLVKQSYGQNNENIISATAIKINSAILGEERSILVSLPENYEQSNKSYPVFYVLDGWRGVIGLISEASGWGICPEMIVVVIDQVNPVRDMFPSSPAYARGTQPAKPWYYMQNDSSLRTQVNGERIGEADKFLKFIETELIPYIDKNYRTFPYSIGSGHSRGGLCVTHAFLSHTNLFNAYIALNPSLYWDDGLLLRTAAEKLHGKDMKYKQYYFTIGGNEIPSTIGDAHAFAEILDVNASDELRWKMDYQQNESHGSGAINGIMGGLKFIYDGWSFDIEKMKSKGIAGIDNFYQNLSNKYGYKIAPDVNTYNSIGWELLRDGKNEEALKIFLENTLRNPDSPDAYNLLAECYLRSGNKDLAILSYKKAIEVATTYKNGNIEFLKKRLETIKE